MNRALAGLLCALLAACASAPLAPPVNDSLYRQLGGEAGISALVEELIVRAVENPRIGDHFASTDLIQLHQRLSEQICVEAGGPCRYSGLSMEDAHAGMDLTEADFNALVEDLIDAMEALEVPVRTQNRLLARLAPMRPQIIHR